MQPSAAAPAEIGTAHAENTVEIISYSIPAKEGVFFFSIQGDLARITLLVRKGQKGYDRSTVFTTAAARKLVARLRKQQ